MEIKINSVELKDVDGMIVPQFEENLCSCEEVQEIAKNKNFLGKDGEIFYFTKNENGLKYIILVGLGKKDDYSTDKMRLAIAKAAKKVKELKIKSLGVKFIQEASVHFGATARAIAEGLRLSTYVFEKYKSEKKDFNISVSITGVPQDKVPDVNLKLQEALAVIDGTILARNLVNEPSNIMYPEILAETVVKIGKDSGFEVEVFDEEAINNLGMKAFQAVAKGSDKAPRLIVMRYLGDYENRDEILGLVGKGLTYDTGGYSLKPSDSMKDMKSDMGGAASVIGAMSAISKMNLKKNVIAVVAACENAISGNSYKPGDIIDSMAGKTIEVLNTDAEGRLTLADAVHYIIEKENVVKIVDVATLTGAALVALGETTTAVVTNNEDFYKELTAAAKKTGEKFWQLPSFDEYKKLIKSDIADLKNVGGKYAGTITAGLFVGEFVQNKPWIHLDIAGTAWAGSATDLMPKGGTGVPVRTLYNLVKGESICHHK